MRSSDTSARRGAQADSRKFPSFNWMRGVADDHAILILQRFVLMRLLLYRNGKNGRCYPSYDRVAADLGIERRSVQRAVAVGVRRGWLARPTRRGPTSNAFAFTFQLRKKDRTAGSCQDHEDRTPQSKRWDSRVLQTGEERAGGKSEDFPPARRESDPSGLGSPLSGAAAPNGAAPVEDEDQESSSSFARTSLSQSHGPKGFAELRRIWARPWPEDLEAAKRAYKVAEAEAGAEVILGAARAWVAAADAPRFLPALTKWLAGRCWEVPPPQRRARSAPHQRRSYRKAKPDLASMMLALGEREG